MQLVNTSRDNLLKPLQVVSGIVERRHTLPILANLLFRQTLKFKLQQMLILVLVLKMSQPLLLLESY